MSLFGDDFKDLYDNDPFKALERVVDTFYGIYSDRASFTDCIECAEVALLIILNNNFIIIDVGYFQYRSGITSKDDIYMLFSTLNRGLEEESVQIKQLEIENEYAFINKKFVYSFSDEQIKTIQTKINELRDFLYTVKGLSDEHRDRLLRKLEKLQAELHKKMSSLDKFYGFMIESAIVLGKMGKAAQPFIDGAEKIVRIAFSVHALSEGLPNLPKLTFSTNDELDEC